MSEAGGGIYCKNCTKGPARWPGSACSSWDKVRVGASLQVQGAQPAGAPESSVHGVPGLTMGGSWGQAGLGPTGGRQAVGRVLVRGGLPRPAGRMSGGRVGRSGAAFHGRHRQETWSGARARA